jgi:hypothetical protein
MRLWPCWGRFEIVANLKALNHELEGLNSQVRELEERITENVAESLDKCGACE